jgi:hypothetical protein
VIGNDAPLAFRRDLGLTTKDQLVRARPFSLGSRWLAMSFLHTSPRIASATESACGAQGDAIHGSSAIVAHKVDSGVVSDEQR